MKRHQDMEDRRLRSIMKREEAEEGERIARNVRKMLDWKSEVDRDVKARIQGESGKPKRGKSKIAHLDPSKLSSNSTQDSFS